MKRMLLALTLISSPAGAQDESPLDEANRRYAGVVSAMAAASEALAARDFGAFRDAVTLYRREMPWVLIWQSRACWAAENAGKNPAYPGQGVMGELSAMWSIVRNVPDFDIEYWVPMMEDSMKKHLETLVSSYNEMNGVCTEGEA